MRTGLSAVEAAERVDGSSYSVPEVVLEPGEGAAVESRWVGKWWRR